VDAVLTGLSIGFASGIAPGPLTILAIAATLRRGRRAGVKIAIAPLLSDTLIILASFTVVSRLPVSVMTWLGLAGGVVVVIFAMETLRAARTADPDALVHSAETERRRFAVPLVAQGFLTNLLNPAPWIFWVTAGSALLVSTWRTSPGDTVGFLVAFYVTLVGSKVVLVLLIGAARHRITRTGYRLALLAAGLLLLLVGAWFIVTAAMALME
jgi:threonine/homoserine/homoserine lactone efflux protein